MKGEKLLLEMIIIVLLVSVVCFWTLNEWNKRYPNSLNGYISEFCIPKNTKYTANFTNPTSTQVKIYKGKWHSNYLEVIK